MGPASDKPDKLLAVKRLATDGTNWQLWKATLNSYFKSRNLLKPVAMKIVLSGAFTPFGAIVLNSENHSWLGTYVLRLLNHTV